MNNVLGCTTTMQQCTTSCCWTTLRRCAYARALPRCPTSLRQRARHAAREIAPAVFSGANHLNIVENLGNSVPAQMAPIVYTPTVGWACLNFQKLYRRPRGMHFSMYDRGHMVRARRGHGMGMAWFVPASRARGVCLCTIFVVAPCLDLRAVATCATPTHAMLPRPNRLVNVCLINSPHTS